MIGVIADVHVGNPHTQGGVYRAGINDRGERILKVLGHACHEAKVAGCDALVILGDLFDRSDPSPQVIARTMAALAQGPPEIVVLRGNHEQSSMLPGHTALAPLAHVPNVRVIEETTLLRYGTVEMLLVPYQPGPAGAWLPDAVKGVPARSMTAPLRVLGLHLGIVSSRTPSFLTLSEDAVSLEQARDVAASKGCDVVMAGNWHDRQLYDGDGAFVVQVGALCPTGWANPGLSGAYGTLLTLRAALPYRSGDYDLAIHELPGPRFAKVAPGGDAPPGFVDDQVLGEWRATALGRSCELFLRGPERERRAWDAYADVYDGQSERSRAARAVSVGCDAADLEEAAGEWFYEAFPDSSPAVLRRAVTRFLALARGGAA